MSANTTGPFRFLLLSLTYYSQVAGNHGRAVGKTIAGDPQPFVKVPIFWSARMLRTWGLATLLMVFRQRDSSSATVVSGPVMMTLLYKVPLSK